MIRNYIIIALRNIQRNKVNSIINIAGLAIGMTCVILILFYVQDELKYDRFFQDADHIFQVNLSGIENGEEFLTGNTAPLVGPAMVNEFPEVESCVRIYRPGDKMVRYEQGEQTNSFFTEKRILAVDSNFLQVFNYEMKVSDPSSCLLGTNSLVLTEQTAEKYFGNTNPMGKTLLFETERDPFIVTGVLKNIPAQSSFQFDMLMPIAAYPVVKQRSWNWFWLQVSTYIKLQKNVAVDKASIEKLESKFPALVKKHAFTRSNMTYEDFIKKGGKLDYHLQPLTSVHLYSAAMGTASRLTTLGNSKYVYIFSIIAFFIIILACVNFMNLSTAQSSKRAREVGIRKVLGSLKTSLIKQFLAESLLISFISTLIALACVFLLLKPFNGIAGKSLDFSLLFSGYHWIFVIGLSVATGLLAGSYPAFYLTSFNPIAVLKDLKLIRSDLGGLFIRNGMVVFQFTISTVLIICTIIIFEQLQFTQTRDLGLNKENVIFIANANRVANSIEAFRDDLGSLPEVLGASVSSSIPSRGNFGDVYIPEPSFEGEQLTPELGLSSFIVDNDFIPTLQIQLLEGRNFSNDFTDSSSVILNETAVKQAGWKEPVGKYLQYPGNSQRFKVIAVVKDFNIESLQSVVAPFALFHTTSNTYNLGNSFVLIRLQPENLTDQIKKVESKWKTFAPNTPFDYGFLDGELDALYRSEQRMGSIFSLFTFLSIFVACLGLFGLAAFTAERRTKEIGVRKVLGASVKSIATMLSKDFVKLVLIASIIAFPIAWWSMNNWLNDFAYRVEMRWWMFALAGFLAIVIAMATVSFQALKAAVANPISSLRSE